MSTGVSLMEIAVIVGGLVGTVVCIAVALLTAAIVIRQLRQR